MQILALSGRALMKFLSDSLIRQHEFTPRCINPALSWEALGKKKPGLSILHECKMKCYVQKIMSLPGSSAMIRYSSTESIRLSVERCMTGEILLKPHLAEINSISLDDGIIRCLETCNEDSEPGDSWYKTIVLDGGSASMIGLPGRLKKELLGKDPRLEGLKVFAPTLGCKSAWFGIGAFDIANMSSFLRTWCERRPP
ncbi:hypothetical protein P3S67_016963 [Capsicum chacoense]